MSAEQRQLTDEDLIARAKRWLNQDTDSISRGVLQKQLESGDMEALRGGFEHPLAFGTAGLRGEVGPGPGRMNLGTIAQVSWSLGQFLNRRHADTEPFVVMGFDARPDSRRFARHAALVLSGCGVRVHLTHGPQPTPVIAFAVRDLKASAGVVVTASHNPRTDNGYKLYDDQGVQIVSPWDTEITQYMTRFSAEQAVFLSSQLVSDLEASVLNRYFAHVGQVSRRWVPKTDPSQIQRLAYTPLHGVGFASVERATAELPVELLAVPSQVEPDGTFPSLAFPNPEEPGALDQLLEYARAQGASVAVANDPDADRFALCLPLELRGSPDHSIPSTGLLTRLSGDALGLLLADLCLRRSSDEDPCIVSTVVSTPALEALVSRRGGRLERTLTGFKWLCRAAIEQKNFVFAYEEALGYCLAGPHGSPGVMDKDGISALTTVARLVSACGGGDTLADRLLGLYRELGLWGSYGHSRRFVGNSAATEMACLLAQLRKKQLSELVGMNVTAVTDFACGADTRPWYLGEQDLIQFDLTAAHPESGQPTHGRVFVRPSGTEPKLKAYVHLRSTMIENQDYLALSTRQAEIAEKMAAAVLGLVH